MNNEIKITTEDILQAIRDRKAPLNEIAEREKHEEVKKIALKLYYHNFHNTHHSSVGFLECWEEAERIYKFAKAKEGKQDG